MRPLFPTLYRNEALRQSVGQLVMQGLMSHAYLIQGAPGTGRRTFAHLVAAALVCEHASSPTLPLPCGQCPACRKILLTGTPDLTHITRGDAATIGVEAIRRMKEDMVLSATEFDYKMYIIEEADTMTLAAQNALLVALEEPPARVVIWLTCENEASLLPTVRSRIQTWHMQLLSQADIAERLCQASEKAVRLQKEAPARFNDLTMAAEGAYGRALALLEGGEKDPLFAQRAAVHQIWQAMLPRVSYSALYDATMHLPTQRQPLLASLRLLSLSLRDLILLKRDEEAPLCFFSDRVAAQDTAHRFSLRCLFLLTDATEAAQSDLRKNANIPALLSSLTTTFYHAQAK